MKVILIALLVVSALCVKIEEPRFTRATQKHIDELQKSKWGKTILDMMELHAMSKGPVQELIQAIDDLIADLEEELQVLEQNFATRTNEHNRDVITLEQDIADAVLDIQRTDDTLENLLKPRRLQLKNKIATIQDYQGVNRKQLNENTLVRNQEHEEYEAQLAEYNSAVEAVDQALQLLGSLSNPSLLQVKEFHVSLRKIEQRIRPHSQQAPLIKALIALAVEQNFSDQNIIGQIVGLMNEFRNSVVDAINASIALENDRLKEFNERVDQLNSEFAEFGRQIIRINIDLTAIKTVLSLDKINELTAFVSQRDQDRKTFQGQLDLENSSFAEETEIFQDLKNQYLRELAVAAEGQKLVKSVDFTGKAF